MRKNMKLGVGLLTVLATPVVINTVDSNEVQAEYIGQVFYHLNKPANWWYSDGQDWYFFKDGRKYTGWGKDNAGEKYFANGKYANWWYDDGSDWYFFKDGRKYTGWGKDNAGEHYYVNGKYANGRYNGKNYVNGKEESIKDGYSNNLFYSNNRLANWWYDDGSDWYFFKDGRKYTGWGKDNAGEHYYVNGKYANGQYNGKNYVNGKEESEKNGYVNNLFYSNNRLANWWYDDGSDWYFFKEGKKYTGWGKDNAGEHYFVNGKYANGQYNGKNYVNGKISANTQPLNMPQYYQGDSRWGNKYYGLSTMRNTGCVPTSLAMAFSGLGKQVKPTDVADVIYYNTNEFNKREIGTSGRGAAYAIRHYGFNYSVIQSKEQLVQALQSGRPVFAAMANGYFVKGNYYTHAVILSGYQNGKTKAMDPDNAYTTGKWYDVDSIWNQRSFDPADTVMGGSFMVIGNN